jgi:glycine cleavage system aminomethyltransferase T
MMSQPSLREQYELASRFGRPLFLERPLIGSPGGPAQAETNTSQIWGHLNSGYLFAYEYTRWYAESLALRRTAMLGDWSWLNKVLVEGPDAEALLEYASVRSIASQSPGRSRFTPMVAENGKLAIEGLTMRLADEEFLFTQSGALQWLRQVQARSGLERVKLTDVTPDFTCFALQGPRSYDVLEALVGEDWRDLAFAHFRWTRLFDTDVMIARQGVTGELGYELFMRTETGRAHELWRRIRDVGAAFGLREMGFKAQMVGHTESNFPTIVRDYLPARMPEDKVRRFARLWISEEELAALPGDLTEHWCSPAELGWGARVNFDHSFLGRDALEREADAGGPRRGLTGLIWSSEDMAELYSRLFLDGESAPPPDLPYGQFRMEYLPVEADARRVGWATSATYSPTLRRMISLARLDRDLVSPGTEVEVTWGGFSSEPTQTIRATTHALPFLPDRRRGDLRA